MKKNILYFLFCSFLAIGFASCDLEETPPYETLTNSKEGAQVYIPKSSNGIHYLNTFSYEELEVTEKDSIGFNVGFGALGLPANDIEINLDENSRVIDSLNVYREINGEALYHPFPLDAYEIDKFTLIIPKGKEYSDMTTFTYFPEKFDQEKNYLLAFSIDDAMGYPINKRNSTIVFVVSEVVMPEPEPKFIDKGNWEVIDYSSEESGEGEGDNGFARQIVDGDENTYWHSCYTVCSETSEYPHHITVDMKTETDIDGFDFLLRNGRQIKDFEILVSNDNIEWRSMGEFNLFANTIPQSIMLEKRENFRYFKIVMKSAHDGDRFASLKEVSAFILE